MEKRLKDFKIQQLPEFFWKLLYNFKNIDYRVFVIKIGCALNESCIGKELLFI